MAAIPPRDVLVIDDDPDMCENLRDILELDGYRVASAGSVAEALRQNDWSCFATIIVDYRLPDGTAEALLPQLRELAPQAAVIVATGTVGLNAAMAALRFGAADFILKPIDGEALRASLARIDERRRLEWAKERSEAAFRTLIEAAPCMIVILSPEHRILYFSPFAEESTGYKAGDVLGKNYFPIFLPPEYHRAVAEDIQRVLGGTPTRAFENPVLRKDGTRRSIIWNVERLPDYEGGPAVLAVGQDITTLKQAQEQALRSERLAAIGQMMAGLTHESGNALARSQSCLEMLQWEVEDRPEALELIKSVQKAQDHLKQLYEEVRGYAAPIVLQRETWDLKMIWRQAWTNMALLRDGREAIFREKTAGLDLHCAVDQFRLEQVFRNILENSLAACRDPVQIEVHCAEVHVGGHPAVRVAVRDNGPGLNPEQRQRIFDPFFTTKTKGTGLGMAIAKRIVEAHGGQIVVGQVANLPPHAGGAVIIITLPRESP